jgi:hypothetical protein
MHMYGNDVDLLCTDIKRLHKVIVDLGSTCESIRRYTIQALQSGPNATFNMYIDRLNDDIESGTGPNKNMTWQDIIIAARRKYSPMHAANTWDKVDPRDAKLLALTTKLAAMEGGTKPGGGGSGGHGGGNGGRNNSDRNGGVEMVANVEKWRTIKGKGKFTKNGKDWWWCPHHVKEDHWDGLYVRHKPSQHKGWRKDGSAPKETKQDADKKDDASAKLTINQRLKEVLCTRLMLSDTDADEICKEIGQEN